MTFARPLVAVSEMPHDYRRSRTPVWTVCPEGERVLRVFDEVAEAGVEGRAV